MAADKRVFISYSSVDRPLARRLARRLQHGGVAVFLDETHLGPGKSLPEALKQEIGASSHVFIVWTASAAGSAWVAQEVEYARTAAPRPVLVPLLVVPPGSGSLVADITGIDFSRSHRFEQAFAQVAAVLGIDASAAPSREVLAADLAATVRETPAIAALFESPIDRAVTGKELLDAEIRETVAPDDPAGRAARAAALAKARTAFGSWQPAGVVTAGLPSVGEPDFHALDFAMWCAAGIALRKTDELERLVAPEVKTYPPIFGKALGATGAGFEAIVLLMTRFPGLAGEALGRLIDAEQVRDPAIPAVVELYDAVFRLVSADDGRDQFMPFSCAVGFFARNRGRLSAEQKRTFFRLADINGNGPYPGGPLDMLGALYQERAFAEEVVERILFWVENGFFDRPAPELRTELPRRFYGFVSGLIAKGAPERDVQRLLDAAAERIRKHFRKGETEAVLLALQWIADADRLRPVAQRARIERGVHEGVYSAELDGWPHASRVKPLAALLAAVIIRGDPRASQLKWEVHQDLKDAGLSELRL